MRLALMLCPAISAIPPYIRLIGWNQSKMSLLRSNKKTEMQALRYERNLESVAYRLSRARAGVSRDFAALGGRL